MKTSKTKNLGGRVGGLCQGGEGSGWGVRVDVNGELKFLGKLTKKNPGGGGGQVGGGQGGCEQRIEELKFL